MFYTQLLNTFSAISFHYTRSLLNFIARIYFGIVFLEAMEMFSFVGYLAYLSAKHL